jgi:hypothetical protein
LPKILRKILLDIVKGALLDGDDVADDAPDTQMLEQRLQRVGGLTIAQPPSTPVPQKLRDALFIQGLHAKPSPMEPMA